MVEPCRLLLARSLLRSCGLRIPLTVLRPKKYPENSQNQVSTYTARESYRADQRSCSALDAHLREASIGCHPPGSIRHVATRIAKMYRCCSVYGCACCIAVRLPHLSPDEAKTSPHFKRAISEHDIRNMVFHFLLRGGWIKARGVGMSTRLIPRDEVRWR